MCDQHLGTVNFGELNYHHTITSKYAYLACWECLQRQLHHVLTIGDVQDQQKKKNFVMECVAWGSDEATLPNQILCLTNLAQLGWSDHSTMCLDHIGHRLPFSTVILLLSTGSKINNDTLQALLAKASYKQCRLLYKYTQRPNCIPFLLFYKKKIGIEIPTQILTFLPPW